MKTKLFAIVFYLFAAVCSVVHGTSIEVRPAGQELFEVYPREIVTTIFRVTNFTNKNYEFESQIQAPEGWALVSRDFPFDLSSNENITKVVSCFVPETTEPGRYQITYLVKSRRYPSIRDFYTIDVVVLPTSEVRVKLLKSPDFAIAGRDYEARFLVTNKSNREHTIRVSAGDSEKFAHRIDNRAFNLTAGESKTVTVTVCPNADISNILRHRLELTAEIVSDGKTEALAKAACSVEVLPKTSEAERIVRTITAQDTIRKVTGTSRKTQLAQDKPEQIEDDLKFVASAAQDTEGFTADEDNVKKKMLGTAIV